MTNDNEEILTPEDRELFHNIAKEVRNKTTKYREAGKWLDRYASEDTYWQRQETNLKELQRKEKGIPVLGNIQRVKQLEKEIQEKRTPALLVRFREARDYLLEKYKDEQFISEVDSRRIVLITWLLTDPDAEMTNLNITEIEKWSWEPIDDVSKLSRGYAQFLWCQGGRAYYPWMKLVRIAWEKLKRESEKWYRTNTFKFVVIPIVCALIVGIPAWVALVNRTGDANQVKTIGDSSPAIITIGPNSPVTVDYESSDLKETQEKILEENRYQTRLLEEMQVLDETNHEKLIQTYPLGYALFAIIDGDEIITQSTNRLHKGWRVDWNCAKIITINENQISLITPSFYSKDGERVISGNIVGVSRKEGTANPVIKAFGIELFCGVLVDDSSRIVCLIGLKEQS